MSLALFVSPKWSFQDDNGGNASGWKLYTYEPGTSTPKAAYQDSAGTTPHANPIVLDARGEAEIWLDGAYKFILKNTADVTKWTSDDVTGTETEPTLLAEYEVTGSAVTSVQFTGLDINTHKSYRIEADLVLGPSGASTLFMYANNNVVVTDYYSQYLQGDASTISAARENNPAVCDITGGRAGFVAFLAPFNNQFISKIQSHYIGTSAVNTVVRTQTAPRYTNENLTKLTFASTVVQGIGVGSKFRIYRGDK